MGVVNRRNAILGWSVWQISKRAAKRKAKQAASRRGGDGDPRAKGAVVSAVAAAGGALWFWRRHRGSDEQS